jgi:hypothetical protein
VDLVGDPADVATFGRLDAGDLHHVAISRRDEVPGMHAGSQLPSRFLPLLPARVDEPVD